MDASEAMNRTAGASFKSQKAPDIERWSDPASYKPEWSERARFAASLLPSNVAVLEIGVGTGLFKELVKERTAYVGADLHPLDPESIKLDLDSDPLPERRFDYGVLLGVFGYLHQPQAAAKKLCAICDRIIVSYCCRRAEVDTRTVMEARRRRGWVNDFELAEFVELFSRHGHELTKATLFNCTNDFEQFIMEFCQSDLKGDSEST